MPNVTVDYFVVVTNESKNFDDLLYYMESFVTIEHFRNAAKLTRPVNAKRKSRVLPIPSLV